MQFVLALTLLLAPTYAVRFGLFGLPTNLLMVWVGLVWLVFGVWLVRGKGVRVKKFLASLTQGSRLMRALLLLFFLAGLVSLFVGGVSQDKLGQFIVLFLQPLSLFFIARFLFEHLPQSKVWFARAAYLFLFCSGVYAVVQYFTLLGVPVDWWGNSNEPKRSVAFFLHPNFYALFITPLLAFLLPNLLAKISSSEYKTAKAALAAYGGAWVIGALGLFFSLSRGGWFGLVAAIGVFVIVTGNKWLIKRALVGLVVISLIIFAIPNFRYRLLLPFYGEKSAVARLSLWDTGWKMVKDSPVLGKGLLGFRNNWQEFNTDPGLAQYPAPHNVFLNFWVEVGLLGLFSFVSLILYVFLRGIKHKTSPHMLGLALFVVVLLVHGLIDTPYLKNDLAVLFWLVLAFW